MGGGTGDLDKALGNLQLLAAEKKGIRIGKQTRKVGEEEPWHAVGKVLADRPISVEVIQRTLGWIWCGDKGMTCKEAGGNRFFFSFKDTVAKKRALKDGPWMVGHNLMVMVAYDGAKNLDDLDFSCIPIWIQVFRLPVGMMSREVAEIIGNVVGVYSDADVEENGTAAGSYLRIKVHKDIRRALMRGVTIETEEEGGGEKWCPFEYEFLPEFCHPCGIIGHTDKYCAKKAPTADRQYGKWMRMMPPRRRFSDDVKEKGQSSVTRSAGDWRKEKENRLREKNPFDTNVAGVMGKKSVEQVEGGK
jgi:hypothetical protein